MRFYINNFLLIDISWYFLILEVLIMYRFQEKAYIELYRIVALRVIEPDILYMNDFPIVWDLDPENIS
jgi:hypothetical protein